MKTRDDVSADKLRGGFYTPPGLVAVCLDRCHELVGDRRDLSALEPSAGDGAFLRGLAAHPLGGHVDRLTAVEKLESESARCREALGDRGRVVTASFLAFAAESGEHYDLAFGNPPFVRYQFVDAADKALMPAIAARLGLKFAGVSNLWIPLFLAAMDRLKAGGAFAFVVPAECFTGVSAGVFRAWLAASVAELRMDVFPAGSYPGVLQEVVVVSGKRQAGGGTLTVREHFKGGSAAGWTVGLSPSSTWTRYLLTPAERAALDTAIVHPVVALLGRLARFEVAIVTGANDYFTADAATVAAYGLGPWARPLLPRARHAAGLRYTAQDHAALVDSGHKAHLLHFAAEGPSPEAEAPARAYLALGERAGLPNRYKCAIREPWYRVPHVRAGRFLLSKRSHAYPRVIVNEAAVLTTDTIYRGAMREEFARHEADFAAAFHNSLTLLTAELEGRSFGGGVLELVPSEVARLAVPLIAGLGSHLPALDARLRAEPAGDLPAWTDALLVEAGFPRTLLERLGEARLSLQRRRLLRGQAGPLGK